MLEVIKAEKTHGEICTCGSWIDHWKNYSRKIITYCAVKHCDNEAEIGSHVQIVEPQDGRIYIVPLCKEHHQSDEVLEIAEWVPLVSADPKVTCKKNKLQDALL